MVENVPPKHFHIFGFPVTSSKSPILHSAGFKYHGLPHTYDIKNCQVLDQSTSAILRDPAFGGASVTMPHKLSIRDYLDSQTPVAQLLGAVNTVIPTRGDDGTVTLVGDNTDWLGILRLLQQELKPRHGRESSSTGLVIGAGGAGRAAVHALHELGLSTIYLYNRTRSTAEQVAESFPEYGIIVVASLEAASFNKGPPICIVGTVPALGTSTKDVHNPGDTLYLSEECLARPAGGVIIEMAYLPRRTPLVRLAEGKAEWSTKTGIMVLLTQGYAQFEMWNGVKAPEKEIEDAVLSAYDLENPL